MGPINVFCMISGLGCLSVAFLDYKLGIGWKLWVISGILAVLNLYLAFEPALAGRIPFSA